jgi:hypothetical protein
MLYEAHQRVRRSRVANYPPDARRLRLRHGCLLRAGKRQLTRPAPCGPWGNQAATSRKPKKAAGSLQDWPAASPRLFRAHGVHEPMPGCRTSGGDASQTDASCKLKSDPCGAGTSTQPLPCTRHAPQEGGERQLPGTRRRGQMHPIGANTVTPNFSIPDPRREAFRRLH